MAKCKDGMGRAFEGVRRQREREKREREEEEKAEKRREEEEKAMADAAERKAKYEKAWEAFVESAGVGKAERVVGADGTVENEGLTEGIVQAFLQAKYADAVALIRKIPGNAKTQNVWLIEARCHEILGDFRSALSAAGHLVQKSASHETWKPGSPRMMAVTLGANAAMQLGQSDKALR